MSNKKTQLTEAVNTFKKTGDIASATIQALGISEASQRTEVWAVPDQATLNFLLLKLKQYLPGASVNVGDHKNGYAVTVSGDFPEGAVLSFARHGTVRVS